VIAEAFAAGSLGGGVGLSELISRYRDAPTRSLQSGAAALYVLLNVGARSVGRRQAEARGTFIQQTGTLLPFPVASQALPAYCFQLMQNTSAEEERQVADLARRLREQSGLDENVKVRIVLLALLTVVGEKVLRQAVEELGPDRPSTPEPQGRSARAGPWATKRHRNGT
jgi:hypothetical protein